MIVGVLCMFRVLLCSTSSPGGGGGGGTLIFLYIRRLGPFFGGSKC